MQEHHQPVHCQSNLISPHIAEKNTHDGLVTFNIYNYLSQPKLCYKHMVGATIVYHQPCYNQLIIAIEQQNIKQCYNGSHSIK